eukprot:CAMPEP_0168329816 /NCGR_PEP_ID=MMETSP0213-20121227/7337_1 /TAXON_ID=151035 /ORGANISM="Euplotes harpa, Strain FSP1.4" /LENGTH=668 /DNA_ID=CAMNT_0008333221 /DNA_START=101 /DNA_END=2107 /DNA_ORIENTATION=-
MKPFQDQLRNEVTSSGIDYAELGTFVWGGQKEQDYHKSIVEGVNADPVITYRPSYGELYREEGFFNNLKRVQRINELAKQGKIPAVDTYNYGTFAIAIGVLYPTSVHHGMFESIVKVLGSEEQIEKYWEDIRAYKILGCYAQTEMGTGSNVQGLETQAVYNEATEEFVIHSPTVKAAKFWPGDLGKLANHAVVFAKLIIKGESYGIHAFFMQIRDFDTHTPLKGIEIGDIGPKYGYPLKDNGYMIFNKVRIPRSAILSKYVNVTKDGIIDIKGDPRIAYATMLYIRVSLLTFNWQTLFINLANTLRYSIKRTQFKSINNSHSERKILDYQATQTKLIPILAYTYANNFMSHFCQSLHDQMLEDIKSSKFKLMNDLHVLISCLKAHYMQEAIDSLMVMRECCGGHGFSTFSGITGWIEAWSPNVTLEGDGYVLYQQTTKKLVKMLNKASKGSHINSEVYPYIETIHQVAETKETSEEVRTSEQLLNVLQAALCHQLLDLVSKLQTQDGHSFDVKWNKIHQVQAAQVSRLHAVYMTAKAFVEGLAKANLKAKTKEALDKLAKIYLCESILRYGEYALIKGYVTPRHMVGVSSYFLELIESVRPDVFGLSEAPIFNEGLVQGAALGNLEGDYASQLFELAKFSKLNTKTVLDGVKDHVKPLSKKLKNFAKM